jgi:hypothetical protein
MNRLFSVIVIIFLKKIENIILNNLEIIKISIKTLSLNQINNFSQCSLQNNEGNYSVKRIKN